MLQDCSDALRKTRECACKTACCPAGLTLHDLTARRAGPAMVPVPLQHTALLPVLHDFRELRELSGPVHGPARQARDTGGGRAGLARSARTRGARKPARPGVRQHNIWTRCPAERGGVFLCSWHSPPHKLFFLREKRRKKKTVFRELPIHDEPKQTRSTRPAWPAMLSVCGAGRAAPGATCTVPIVLILIADDGGGTEFCTEWFETGCSPWFRMRNQQTTARDVPGPAELADRTAHPASLALMILRPYRRRA